MDVLNHVVKELEIASTSLGFKSSTSLPPVIVVGMENSGKSSVIENIVGKPFLPKNNGKQDLCATRRPIEVYLRNSEGSRFQSVIKDEYLDQKKIPYKKTLLSFSEVAEALTDVMNKSIPDGSLMHFPVKLYISGPGLLKMSLVDLPPFILPKGDNDVMVSTSGNIAQSYVHRVRNTLVLCCISSHDDIKSSYALEQCKMLDPKQKRTLLILSKLDELKKNKLSIALTYLKKSNPSGNENTIGLIANKANDSTYFKMNSDKFQTIRTNHLSFESLRDLIMNYFLVHIHSVLQPVKKKLSDLQMTASNRLLSYGEELSTLREDRIRIMETLVFEIIHKIFGVTNGTIVFDTNLLKSNPAEENMKIEKYGGSKIRDIFVERFIKEMEAKDPLHGVSDSDITMRIFQSSGVKTILFTPTEAFEGLVKNRISELLPNCLFCIDLVYFEMKRICDDMIKFHGGKFPEFVSSYQKFLDGILSNCTKACKTMISHQIDSELGFINTNHPDFRSCLANIHGMYKNNIQLSREELDVKSFRIMLKNYFDIIKKNFMDSVQKIAVYKICNTFLIKMKELTVIEYLAKEGYNNVMNLMTEDPVVEKKRARTKKMIEMFSQTSEKLQFVENFQIGKERGDS